MLNCPHPAIFAQHLRGNPRQLARSWYMFFFQIPWLPETLLGLGPRLARSARAHPRLDGAAATPSPTRTCACCATRPAISGALRAALNYYRAAFRDRPDADAPARLRCDASSTATEPLPAPRRTLADWPTITAPTLLIWGEQDVALGKELTLGMEPLFSGPFERPLHPRLAATGCSRSSRRW